MLPGFAVGDAHAGAAVDGGQLVLRSSAVEITLDLRGGLPVRWLACAGDCTDPAVPRQVLLAPADGMLQWQSERLALGEVGYAATVHEGPESIVAELSSIGPVDGQPLVQRYELSRSTHRLQASLSAPAGTRLWMESGAGFVPAQLPGFGAAFSTVDTVSVSGDGQQALGGEDAAALIAGPDSWTGVRSRFWAWLVQPATPASVAVQTVAPNRQQLVWQVAGSQIDLAFYGGPVEWKSLRVVDKELTGTLFAALWDPLRWLCFGLLFLLGFITSFVGSEGVAIVLLSLAVKIILFPLTHIADRWQAGVNRARSRLAPRLAAIRQQYRGEDAHNRTLQAYREEGVHPLYTLKSLAGFAIQVPMFIAAFDMLAGNFALDAVPFLWIADLAAPDRLVQLPFALPFFGADLNLLPFLMTAVTVISALVQREASLSAELQARQQRNLYLMAIAFFLLFYTFPAGMVLYWTANNVWHLVKVLIARRFS